MSLQAREPADLGPLQATMLVVLASLRAHHDVGEVEERATEVSPLFTSQNIRAQMPFQLRVCQSRDESPPLHVYDQRGEATGAFRKLQQSL